MNMTSKIIYTDGHEEEVVPANGKYFQLKQLQNIVGGYIELVSLTAPMPNGLENLKDLSMIINEEGKGNSLPINEKATALFQKYYGNTDFIVGNVLICEPELFV
jgi:hypothetical protein